MTERVTTNVNTCVLARSGSRMKRVSRAMVLLLSFVSLTLPMLTRPTIHFLARRRLLLRLVDAPNVTSGGILDELTPCFNSHSTHPRGSWQFSLDPLERKKRRRSIRATILYFLFCFTILSKTYDLGKKFGRCEGGSKCLSDGTKKKRNWGADVSRCAKCKTAFLSDNGTNGSRNRGGRMNNIYETLAHRRTGTEVL